MVKKVTGKIMKQFACLIIVFLILGCSEKEELKAEPEKELEKEPEKIFKSQVQALDKAQQVEKLMLDSADEKKKELENITQ